MIFNDRLDAAVAAFFMAAVVVILVESVRVWLGIMSGRVKATTTEVQFSHTRDFAIDAAMS
jgi:carbon starvation protein